MKRAPEHALSVLKPNSFVLKWKRVVSVLSPLSLFSRGGSHMLLQSRLAQQGLSTLDVGGAGDCFFRAVSHQLYGEPSYHMNIRCVGVQYMRTNPERFIESIAGDSWA